MGIIRKPLPGKLIVSAIYSSFDLLHEAIDDLEKKYGRVEYESGEFDFLHTSYYREEMGDDLRRKFFSFEKPAERDSLIEMKLFTNKIEEKYGEKSGEYVFRKVNLDPGILTLSNLVLATTKDFSHRIYLGNGIFAEVTLLYKKNKYEALPWTYPDYTEGEALQFFVRVRETIKGMAFDE